MQEENTVVMTAEEIEQVSAMLKNIGNFEVDVSEVIDWLDGNAKETETEEVDEHHLFEDSKDSEDEVPSTKPVKIKNEDAIKALNVL